MIDIATAYNKYSFLGHEFLTWLWFTIENDSDSLATPDLEILTVHLGARMVLENPTLGRTERITAKGEQTNFDTARLSLQQGAHITEMGLCFKGNSQEWQFTIKGESLSLSNLKTPGTAPIETAEEMESAVLEKVYLLELALGAVDRMFQTYIRRRVSSAWQQEVMPALLKWIAAFQR